MKQVDWYRRRGLHDPARVAGSPHAAAGIQDQAAANTTQIQNNTRNHEHHYVPLMILHGVEAERQLREVRGGPGDRYNSTLFLEKGQKRLKKAITISSEMGRMKPKPFLKKGFQIFPFYPPASPFSPFFRPFFRGKTFFYLFFLTGMPAYADSTSGIAD